jgi:lipid-A-disaccharide synthase-like uncharacterized protein
MDKWIIFGFVGQVLFASRFFVQWLASEIRKKSYVPTVFWYLSIFGGIVLFIYALHIKDIVFTVGQGAGIIIYLRNLVLIKRARVSP